MFTIDLEKVVDVAESSRPDRNAVFQEKESTASAWTREDAGSNGSQVFLAGASRNPHPGDPDERFVDVVGAHEFQSFSVHGGAAAGGFGRRDDGSFRTDDNLF